MTERTDQTCEVEGCEETATVRLMWGRAGGRREDIKSMGVCDEHAKTAQFVPALEKV